MKKSILIYYIFILMSSIGYSQEELYYISYKDDFSVYKNPKSNTFKIFKNEKIVFDKLNFWGVAGNSFQILNENNELFYLNDKLKKISENEIKEEEIGYCGTVDEFYYKIIETEKNYLLELKTNYLGGVPNKIEILDTISKKNIKNISFIITGNKEVFYTENDDFVNIDLFIETNDNKKGLRGGGHTLYFDEIDTTNLRAVKVKRNGLYGYFGVTKTKYKKLENYKYNLAKFELPNGQKGYIDYEGNEYFTK